MRLVPILLLVTAASVQMGAAERSSDAGGAASPLPPTVPFRDVEPIDLSAESKAIRRAEEFVAEQGYTDQPVDRDKLKAESFMRPVQSIDDLIKERSRSEEYAIMKKRTGFGSGYPDTFTIDVHAGSSDDAIPAFPVPVRAKLTSDPKDAESGPPLQSHLTAEVDQNGVFKVTSFGLGPGESHQDDNF